MGEGPSEPDRGTSARVAPVMGYACLAGATITYGTLWPIYRVGVQIMPPLWFACVRIAGASLVMFIVVAAVGRLRMPSRQDLPPILSVGVFMLGIYTCLTHIGMEVVAAGRATLLAYTTPLWVAPLAALLLGERLGPMRLSGIALGLAGLAILFNPVGFDWSERRVVTGNGLLLLGALSWTVAIIQMRTQRFRLTPFQLLPWQLLVAAGCIWIGALIVDPAGRLDPTPYKLTLIVIGGPVGTSIGVWLMTMTLRHLPAMTCSVGFLGIPVASTLVAAAFLGEALTLTLVVGLVVTIAGLALVIIAQSRSREPAA